MNGLGIVVIEYNKRIVWSMRIEFGSKVYYSPGAGHYSLHFIYSTVLLPLFTVF